MSLLTRDFLAPFRRRTAPEARSPLAEAEPAAIRPGVGGRRLTSRFDKRLQRRRRAPVVGAAESLERRLALAVDIAPITGNGFFFVDTGQGRTLDSEYSGYAITNNDPVTYADAWVQAHDFTGGVLNLSPNEDGVYHLGQLDPGETDRAWFYLTATGASLTPQSYVISVYNGDPREGGTLIPGATQSVVVNRVEETIEASSNKVFSVSYDTLNPVLGGTLAMTVTGDLGQAGGDSVLFTPDTFNTWQPGVFELETMTITITGTNARTVTDELFLTGFASASNNLYTAVYTFRVVDVIATETPVSPTQFVGRNLQWKHDQPIGVAFPPVPAVTNPLLLEKLVAPAGSMVPPAPSITIPDTGETVEFSLTFSNSSTRPASLDSIRDTLPPGTVYVPGSAMFGGLPLGDPAIVGSQLAWLGPFAVPPLGIATLTFDAVMPAVTGVYINSSVGRIGSVQIDTTLNTKDDVPATATVTCAKFADLAITKTDDQLEDIPGTSLVYTITVTNAGPSGVTGVPVIDNFPAALEGVSWTVAYADGASGPMMGTGNINVLLGMPKNSSATFTVTTTIDEEATGTLLNTATVGVPSGVFDPNPANNTSTDTTLLRPTGDLSITKTDGQMTDVPGTGLTYTIVVANSGPSAVTGALVSDAFPPDLTDISWSVAYAGGSGPMGGAGPLLNQAVNLAAGGTATFTVTAMILGTARGTLSNTSTVAAPPGFTDPNPTNNTATDTTILLPEADLAVVKTRTSGEPVAGAAVEYLISVTNNGPSTILSFTLLDTTAPALIGATFGAPSMGSYNTGTGAWTGLMLATGQTVTITLSGTVPGESRGDLVNTAEVTPPVGVTDPDLDNNTSIVTDVIALVADLNVVKLRTSGQPVAGEEVTYQITVTNQGPTTIDSFSGLDTTTPALEDVDYMVNVGTYDPGTGIWTGPPLATGASVVFTLTGLVPAVATGSLVNTVTVAPPPDVTDPDFDNNTSTVTDEIDLVSDLAVVKTRTSGEPVAGAAVEYLISVTNNGPSTIVSFTLLDTTAPALVGATFGAPSMGSYNTGTGAWTGLMLATGQTVTITLSGTVPGEARGDLVNTAEVTPPADVTDPDLDNNTSIVTDAIALVADLAVTKVRTSAPPVAGVPVTYLIEVANNGPTTVTGFTLTDTTAPGLIGATFGTPSMGLYDPATGVWTGLMLATGQSVTITLTGTVPADSVGLLQNTADVMPPADVTDPNLLNNTATVTDVITGEADLAVLKTRTSGEPVAGAAVEYLITVTNKGPSTILGFTLLDTTAPALIGATFGAPSMGSYNTGTGAWTGLMLATGQTVTITLSGTVPGEARGDLVNTAEALPPAGVIDPDPDDNTSTVTDVIALVADLNVVKLRTSGQPVAGEEVTYQITVTNQGPTTIDSFSGLDTTTPALEDVDYMVNVGTYDPGTGIWTGPPLATGASVVFTLTGLVPAVATGSLMNTVTVAPPPDVTDPDFDNNTSTVTDEIDLVSDLAVVKTRTSGEPVAGAAVEYLISVTNNGPSTIVSFTLLDTTAPALIGATFGAPSMGSYNTGTGAWTGLMLATGQSVTITLSGTVPGEARGDLMNTAEVMPPADVTDPDLDNNTSIVTDVLALVADLAVVKTRTSGQPVAGLPVTYSIVVTNLGPSSVTSFTGTDVPTPLLEDLDFVVSTGTYDVASGLWTADPGDSFATGETVIFTLSGTVPAGATGLLVNTVTGLPPDGVIDPDLSNNTSTVTDEIDLVGDLAIVKSGPASDIPGTSLTYTLVVSNPGPSDVTGAAVSDALPGSLLGATWTAIYSLGSTGPSDGTGSLSGVLVNLLSGGTATFTIVGTIDPLATGLLENTATVTPPEGFDDPNPENNESSVTTELVPTADLAVVKTRTSGQPVAGLPVTYSIVVTNLGPSSVTSFTGTDVPTPLLEDLDFVVSTGTYDVASGLWTADPGDSFATGETVIFTLTGTVPAGATGLLVNTVTGLPPDGVIDPDLSNNTSTVTDEIDLVGDLAIVKSGPASDIPGTSLTYTLVVSNPGPSDVSGAAVSDALPGSLLGATWTAIYSLGSTGPSDGTGSLSGVLVNLLSGGTATFTIVGTIDPLATGLLENTATVTPPEGFDDPNPENNTSSVTTELVPTADLAVVKTRTSGQPVAGLPVTYSIVVTNLGPSSVMSFTGTDVPTPLLEDLDFVVSTGTYDVASGLWTADPGDSFATGETVIFTLTGTVPAGATGLLVNTVTGLPPDGVIDPDLSNNTSTVTDEIGGVIDLTATKIGDETYKGGGFLNFTVVVTNQGPTFAAGVRVVDALPVGVVNWSWTVSYTGLGSGTADGSPDSATDSTAGIDKLMNLAVLGTATFTITALTDDVFQSDITNTVVATIGEESATASWSSAYDGPINPTADVGALVVSNDDLCFGLPFVRVLDPTTGAVLSQFLAYEPSFRGSVRVATGDLTGDGVAEIIVAPGRNRIGQIRVFTPEGVELPAYRTFAFGPAYRGGVDVAVGDIDGDGVNEIIASRSSGLSRVNVFGVDPLAADPVTNGPIRTFIGIPGAYRNGAVITAGDYGTFTNGMMLSATPDGIDEIAVGSNAGIRAQVRVFDASLAPRQVGSFVAIRPGFRGGVTLSSARWDGDLADDIIVGAGVGGQSIVEVYGGGAFSRLARLAAFSSFGRPNAVVNAAALDIDGDGIADNLYGVQGRGGSGGTRGVRRFDRITTATATLPSSTVLVPPLRIAPITLRIPGG